METDYEKPKGLETCSSRGRYEGAVRNMKIIKRNGSEAAFDITKIIVAVSKGK